MVAVLFLLASGAVLVRDSGADVRATCDTRTAVVANLPGGTEVSLRFSLPGEAGTCYKVSARLDNKLIEGYVPASLLTGTDGYRSGVSRAKVIPVPEAVALPAVAGSTGPPRGGGSAGVVRATELLNRQQPRAALDLMEKQLKAGGAVRDPDTLMLAGLAARAADQPKAALGYLEEAQGKRPDPAIARVLAELRKELAGDASSEKLYSDRFLLRFEEGTVDRDTARSMLSLLEAEFSRVSAELGCRVDERIVTIVQSPAAYRASSDAAEWSSGVFDGARIRVPFSQGTGAKVREIFAHELVHACLASIGRFPPWLHEGMAQRVSVGPASPAVRQRVRSLLRGGVIPRLNNTGQTWMRLSPAHAANAYSHALVAVDVLLELHAARGISNLLADSGQLTQFADEIDAELIR